MGSAGLPWNLAAPNDWHCSGQRLVKHASPHLAAVVFLPHLIVAMVLTLPTPDKGG
jgi:hypothetical protein